MQDTQWLKCSLHKSYRVLWAYNSFLDPFLVFEMPTYPLEVEQSPKSFYDKTDARHRAKPYLVMKS